MSEWEFLQIKDLISDGSLEKPLDGNHGGIHPKGADFVSSGIPFIMASDIKNSQIDLVGCKFISKQQALSLRKGFAKTGDVLLTHKATLGRTAIVPPLKTDFIMLTPQVTYYRIKDKKRINNHYLKYYFDTPDFQQTLANHGDAGSTRAYIGITAQHDLPVILPPINEQKAIASVLYSLDDKIDLLHRQNKTLESMAETLFRQWFIEEAQDDWMEGTLGSIASNVRENITKKNIASEALYVGLEHIDRRNIALLKNGNGCDVDSNKSKFSTGDILFGKLRPYFHKVCTAPYDGICSTDILVIRPKKHNLQCFSLFAFFQDEVIEFANIASGGTRMPRIDWASLANYPISLPPDDKLNDFEKIVSSQVRKINFNINTIKKLEKLRDTLLPKLMSGEVRVQYAEEAIASVA